MAQKTLEMISAASQAIAAVGTLAAVVVSLWLARRQGAPRLRVRNAIVQLVQRNQNDPDEREFFQITVTNTGGRDVRITVLAGGSVDSGGEHSFNCRPIHPGTRFQSDWSRRIKPPSCSH